MTTVEQLHLMTLTEYIRLYEQEGAFELVDGERIPLMPTVALHGWLFRALFRLLDAFCTEHDLGEVITEMPYVMVDSSDWVKGSLVPDLMFLQKTVGNSTLKPPPICMGNPS